MHKPGGNNTKIWLSICMSRFVLLPPNKILNRISPSHAGVTCIDIWCSPQSYLSTIIVTPSIKLVEHKASGNNTKIWLLPSSMVHDVVMQIADFKILPKFEIFWTFEKGDYTNKHNSIGSLHFTSNTDYGLISDKIMFRGLNKTTNCAKYLVRVQGLK